MRLAVLGLLLASAALGAGTDLPVTRIGGVDYVSLDDGAALLGLRVTHSVPDTAVMLKSGAQPVARLAAHSRDIDIRGLRVFLGEPVLLHAGAFFISQTDFQVRLLPRLRPDLCGPAPLTPHVIAIDPGHGGSDPGGINKALGTMEKTYTLDVALRLKKLLEAAGYKVVMTRETDFDLPKPLRSEIANRASADFFVSIHFNVILNDTTTTGVEIMSFPPRSQKSTEAWSPGRKNDEEDKASSVNAFNPWNILLAGSMHRALLDALHEGDRGEKYEHLGVLRGLKCPGVLVEPAFISSSVEAGKLKTEAFRDKIAAGILQGIVDYTAAIRALHPAAVEPPAAAQPQRSQPTRPTGS